MTATAPGLQRLRSNGTAWFACSLAGLVFCWWWLWTQQSYWNPLAFTGLWTCATVCVRALSGRPALSWRRHLALLVLSAPLWWWFEFVNEFVRNWHYHGAEQYSPVEYQVFATLAFSTVVPALDAGWGAALRWLPAGAKRHALADPLSRSVALRVLAGGVVAQAAVFLWPSSAYALVWVAPFLVLDGLVSLRGGGSLVHAMRAGAWHTPGAVALGGIACGVLWELWNFYATPKWTYDVPLVGFWHVFEMPLLGYGGYVPFAWSVYQAVALVQHPGWLPAEEPDAGCSTVLKRPLIPSPKVTDA